MPKFYSSKNESTTLLGFGDVRGFFDFDSMTVQLSSLDFEGPNSVSLPSHLITLHETNHWHQQISTTVGNFTSMVRYQYLKLSSVLFQELKPSIRDEIMEGTLTGPLNHVIRQETIANDIYGMFTASNEEISNLIKFCRYCHHANVAIGTSHWLSNLDEKTVDTYTHAFCQKISDVANETSDEQEKNDNSSGNDLSSINRLKKQIKSDIKSLNEDSGYEKWKIFDLSSILEASCVIQEIAYAIELVFQQYDLAGARDSAEAANLDFVAHRFADVFHSDYSDPIKYLFQKLSLEWKVESFVVAAGLFSHIVEVALNPPLPPRCTNLSKTLNLFDLHPSLRFATMIENIDSETMDLTKFSQFRFMSETQKEVVDIYLSNCADLAKGSDISFKYRLSEHYIHGSNDFQEYLSMLESHLSGINPFFQKETDNKYSSWHFILDCGFNGIFRGGVYLQNSILLNKRFASESLSLVSDYNGVGKLRTKCFEKYLFMGIMSLPFEFTTTCDQKFYVTPFLGKYTVGFMQEIRLYLAIYKLMFEQKIGLRLTNHQEVIYNSWSVGFLKDILNKEVIEPRKE